jgi:hypothetical protein
MSKVTRKEQAGKIDVSVTFDNRKGFTFGVRGVTLRFASDQVDDTTHRKVSRVFDEFFHRSTLKVPISVKFNMIENLCTRAKDFSDFLKNWSEQRLYAMPQEVTEIDPPPPEKPSEKAKKAKEAKPRNLAPQFHPKYTYPDNIVTAREKKKYRAMMRAKARKEKENENK